MSATAAAEHPGRLLPAILVTAGGVAAAVAFGLLLPSAPLAALALVVLVPLALLAPLASLAAVLFLTVIVPFDVQNRLAVFGGEEVPGLLAVDLLVLVGLVRVAPLVLAWRARRPLPVAFAAGLALVLAAALVHGIARGAEASDGGTEARRLFFGAAAFLLAWPLVADAGQRRRLYGVLVALGLALGAWGLVQWFGGVAYTTSGDVGIRPGVAETSGGRGQLQGGLYGFPLAVTLAFAALLLERRLSPAHRGLIAAAFGLNAVCLVLTYERTLWAQAFLGCAIVTLWGGRAAVGRALRWAPVALATVLLALAASGPGELKTALERAASVSRYRTDRAVEYRQVESAAVAQAIRARPLTGAGLGATITWGRPGLFATETTPFAHNGYLWLAWKLGIPVALLIVAALLAVVVAGLRRAGDRGLAVVGAASAAAVAGVLLVNMTFPAFNALGATAAIGVLIAFALRPRAPGQPSG